METIADATTTEDGTMAVGFRGNWLNLREPSLISGSQQIKEMPQLRLRHFYIGHI
jgi:hypothetical protein